MCGFDEPVFEGGVADENADELFRYSAFQVDRDVHGFVGSMINASKRDRLGRGRKRCSLQSG